MEVMRMPKSKKGKVKKPKKDLNPTVTGGKKVKAKKKKK
jgi:hypothetical protein